MIDSHIHLDADQYDDPDEVIKRAPPWRRLRSTDSVRKMMDITIEVFARGVSLCPFTSMNAENAIGVRACSRCA
jgi:hypothetical protein